MTPRRVPPHSTRPRSTARRTAGALGLLSLTGLAGLAAGWVAGAPRPV